MKKNKTKNKYVYIQYIYISIYILYIFIVYTVYTVHIVHIYMQISYRVIAKLTDLR